MLRAARHAIWYLILCDAYEDLVTIGGVNDRGVEVDADGGRMVHPWIDPHDPERLIVRTWSEDVTAYDIVDMTVPQIKRRARRYLHISLQMRSE